MSPSPSAPRLDAADPILRRTYDTDFAREPSTESYPSARSVPRIPSERLARAHPALHNHPADTYTVVSSPPCSGTLSSPSGPPLVAPDEGESTVLYLAYGSNLCAKTFLGVRGIRPLSQVSVSAPSLTLTFDLPGFPYREPCFANVAARVRKIPKIPGKPPGVGGAAAAAAAGRANGGLPGEPPIPVPELPPALVGVVYEVTTSDFAKIIATEGGGASYQQIVVPCLALPPPVQIPERPDKPEVPKPFLARTLCMPRLPEVPDDGGKTHDGDGDDGDGDGDDGWKDRWKKKLARWLLPVQRPEGYAQPSLRYLSLLRVGALEHELPQSYQDYLAEIQHYTITSRRQKAGQFLLSLVFGPSLLLLFGLGRIFGDDTGRNPGWLSACMMVFFQAVWRSYDLIFKRMFGDGEKTEDREKDGEDEDGGQGRRRKSSVSKRLRRMSGVSKIVDEEKRALLTEDMDSD